VRPVAWLRIGCVAVVIAGCSRRVETPVRRVVATVRVGTLDGKAVMAAAADAGVGLLDDGSVVLSRGPAGWEPVATSAHDGAVLALNDGRRFWGVRYPDGEGHTEAHWIAPAHRREEVERRLHELTAEAGKLPAPIAARVTPELPLIALVSATEGDFGDPATHPDDRAASVGIFQWAAERDALHAAGSSLSRFFVALKKRAAAKEDPLYVRAWKQCTRRGLDVRRGELRLRKKAATPAEVVAQLRDTFGEDALRTYQLVAALDWIGEVRATVVRPGHRGGALIGHGYAEAEGGRMVRFDVGGRPVRVRATAVATVGEVLRSATALATAVSLGVNRPHYVESALWQTLSQADAGRRLVDALEAGRLDEVRTVLWPTAPSVDERTLLATFRERALELYRPADRERRARRLATALWLEAP
jgi:hypothetical protein